MAVLFGKHYLYNIQGIFNRMYELCTHICIFLLNSHGNADKAQYDFLIIVLDYCNGPDLDG